MLDRLLGTTKEQRAAITRLKEQIAQLEAELGSRAGVEVDWVGMKGD